MRLERGKESERITKHLCLILHCEGWQRIENEFADEMFEIFDAFETPLKNSGVEGSATDIYQWHELLEYAKDTIGASGKSYMVTWREIFASSRSENWRDILTLI